MSRRFFLGPQTCIAALVLALFPPAGAAESINKGTISGIFAGARFSSNSMRRGVSLYPDYQVDPFVIALFFDDRLEFLGDAVNYRDFVWGDTLRLRTRLARIDDDPGIPAHEGIKRNLPNRETSAEWVNSLEFFLPGYNESYVTELNISHSKDLMLNGGNYFEAVAKVKLLHFSLLGQIIEPNAVGTLGWGDANHNGYLYGLDSSGKARDGLNNMSYGLWIAIPKKVDRWYPMIQLMRFETLGDFRDNQFARERSSGYVFSFMAALKVF